MKYIKPFSLITESSENDIIRNLQKFLYSYFEKYSSNLDIRFNIQDEYPDNFIHLYLGNFEATIMKGYDGRTNFLTVSSTEDKKEFNLDGFEEIAKYLEQFIGEKTFENWRDEAYPKEKNGYKIGDRIFMHPFGNGTIVGIFNVETKRKFNTNDDVQLTFDDGYQTNGTFDDIKLIKRLPQNIVDDIEKTGYSIVNLHPHGKYYILKLRLNRYMNYDPKDFSRFDWVADKNIQNDNSNSGIKLKIVI